MKAINLQYLLDLVEFINKFNEVNRNFYIGESKRLESVSKHSYKLAMTAWDNIKNENLKYNFKKLFKLCLDHNLIENYSGDTFIYTKVQKQLYSKVQRKENTLLRIERESEDFPEIKDSFFCQCKLIMRDIKEFKLSEYKKIRTPFVFPGETGSINDLTNSYFGLGIIKCMQPYFLDYEIRLLRQRLKLFEEIKWNTISKKEIKALKSIIDTVFKTPGINFCGIIINKKNFDFEEEFDNNPYLAYQSFSEELIKNSIGNREILTVLADYITTPNEIRYEVSLKHSINLYFGRLAISGVHRIDSKGSNILQIVDLFLGAVMYEIKLENKLVKGDKNKLSILKYILEKLNRKSFLERSITKRFKVIMYENKKEPSSKRSTPNENYCTKSFSKRQTKFTKKQ